MKLSDLKIKTPAELLDLAQSLGIENISRAKKQTLIFAILKHKADNDEEVLGDGVLDILQEGYGFLRSSNDSYVSGPDDIYVSPNQIRRFNLSTGDVVTGKIRAPKKGEKYFALISALDLKVLPVSFGLLRLKSLVEKIFTFLGNKLLISLSFPRLFVPINILRIFLFFI